MHAVSSRLYWVIFSKTHYLKYMTQNLPGSTGEDQPPVIHAPSSPHAVDAWQVYTAMDLIYLMTVTPSVLSDFQHPACWFFICYYEKPEV